MSEDVKHVVIDVSGLKGSGKSSIMQLIAGALNGAMIPFSVRSMDPQPPRPQAMHFNILESLRADGLRITLQERQVSKLDILDTSSAERGVPKPPAPIRPSAGETWYAQLRGASVCITCFVNDVTDHTVLLSATSGYKGTYRYPLTEVKFIEKLGNNQPAI